MSTKVLDSVKPGVLFGDDVAKVFQIAKENKFALPAVNVVGSDSINGVLEAAASVNSPVIIQFSNGGPAFTAGKGCPANGAVLGAIAGAQHVHAMAAGRQRMTEVVHQLLDAAASTDLPSDVRELKVHR